MKIQDIQHLYSMLPQSRALKKTLEDVSVRNVFLKGLLGSAASLFFAGMAKNTKHHIVFILNDNEEAGYFYHDLTQVMGTDHVLFYPSSFKRAVKYGQRDAANDILRTEVLTRLSAIAEDPQAHPVYVVTYPDALSQL
ncbi:MAG: transcription-repair coupling factor, partial [Prevotella sp.]|nr:transcription-repair coupling factor [Prevotella sp.]